MIFRFVLNYSISETINVLIECLLHALTFRNVQDRSIGSGTV